MLQMLQIRRVTETAQREPIRGRNGIISAALWHGSLAVPSSKSFRIEQPYKENGENRQYKHHDTTSLAYLHVGTYLSPGSSYYIVVPLKSNASFLHPPMASILWTLGGSSTSHFAAGSK